MAPAITAVSIAVPTRRKLAACAIVDVGVAECCAVQVTIPHRYLQLQPSRRSADVGRVLWGNMRWVKHLAIPVACSPIFELTASWADTDGAVVANAATVGLSFAVAVAGFAIAVLGARRPRADSTVETCADAVVIHRSLRVASRV